MNILHINNFHYLRGGCEAVYFGTADILEKHGHKSVFFSMTHPENLPCDTKDYFVPYVNLGSNGNGVFHHIKSAGRILYSFDARRRLASLLDNHHVNVAHLHNIYHEISPSIIDTLKARHIPMVMTLHDCKMACASYTMLADGKSCESCSGGRYYYAVKKRCIKGSFLKSILASMEMYLHNNILHIYDKVDAFISPGMFLKNKLEEMGFKKEIIYLPNFIDVKKFGKIIEGKNTRENCIVYFGRLSPEKGLMTLLEAAKMLKNEKNKETKIKIIGDGAIRKELEEEVKTKGISNVEFLGYLKGDFLYKEIMSSVAVVLPSECYENNPISILEAFALGKPVIGSRIGGIPELVIDGESGYTFESKNADDLKDKIMLSTSNMDTLYKMGRNARHLVEEKYNEDVYYEGLMSAYRNIMREHGK